MSKICDMKDCGKPADWTYVTWDSEKEGPKLTDRIHLCEEHAERYKDHEDVVERVRHGEMDALTAKVAKLEDKIDRLERKIRRLEDKTDLTDTFNE